MVLISLAAILFQQSATRSWLSARAADGRHYEVSPIGVDDLGLGTSGTAARQCRWWPQLGDAELCALVPGGDKAMMLLRRAYPLTVVSLWSCVLALFLVALRIPRRWQSLGLIVTAVIPALAVAAIWSLTNAAPRALAALAGTSTSVIPRGFGSIAGGGLLMVIAVVLLLVSRSRGHTPALGV
jgi:hypothetical protein